MCWSLKILDDQELLNKKLNQGSQKKKKKMEKCNFCKNKLERWIEIFFNKQI